MAYIDKFSEAIDKSAKYEIRIASYTNFPLESILYVMYKTRYGIKTPIKIIVWPDGTITEVSVPNVEALGLSFRKKVGYTEPKPKQFNENHSVDDVLNYIGEIAEMLDNTYEKAFKWMKENRVSYSTAKRLRDLDSQKKMIESKMEEFANNAYIYDLVDVKIKLINNKEIIINEVDCKMIPGPIHLIKETDNGPLFRTHERGKEEATYISIDKIVDIELNWYNSNE
jgi:hypothetical protein